MLTPINIAKPSFTGEIKANLSYARENKHIEKETTIQDDITFSNTLKTLIENPQTPIFFKNTENYSRGDETTKKVDFVLGDNVEIEMYQTTGSKYYQTSSIHVSYQNERPDGMKADLSYYIAGREEKSEDVQSGKAPNMKDISPAIEAALERYKLETTKFVEKFEQASPQQYLKLLFQVIQKPLSVEQKEYDTSKDFR